MLNKRTNILFKEETWDKLTALAQAKDKSVGELVRKAVNEVYFSQFDQAEEALSEILKIRKIQSKKVDYKKLIDDGRRY